MCSFVIFRVSFVTEIRLGSGVGDRVLDLLFIGDRDRRLLSRPGGDRRLTGDRDRLRIGDRDRRRGGDPPRLAGDLDRRLGDIDLLGLRLNDGDRRLLGDGDRRLGDLRLGDGLLRPRPRGDGLLRPPLPRGDGEFLLLTGDLRRSPPRSPPLRRSTGDREEPDDDDELDDEDEDEEELELELDESRRPRPFRSRDLDLGMISVRQSKSDSKMG